jgi:glycosyltransferase involved in cell wall biosynthesis
MHAVFIDTTLTTPPTGGAQTFLADLAHSLVQRGFRISIITQPGPESAVAQALTQVGAEVHMNLWSASHLPEEKAPRLARWVNTQDVTAYVVSISPDVGWLALPQLDPRITTFSIAHNDVGAFYLPVTHYAPLIDCAIGVSLETTHQLRNRTGIESERVRYIPYGVHALSPAAAERRVAMTREVQAPLRIGYVGRVVEEQKRVMDFIDVISALNDRDVTFELHIIGEGIDRPRFEQKLNEKGFARYVKFWGWLTPAQVKSRLADLDVFTLMSDYEGLPVALLEAMGQALVPVVTQINSGSSELIRNGENGLMFPVGDSAACAAHLAKLAADENLLRILRRAAWNTAQDYSVERMVDSYEQCFREVSAPDFSRAHRAGAPQPYPLLPACKSPYPFWLRKVKRRLGALRSVPMQMPGQPNR